MQFPVLSDSDAEVAKLYGVDTYLAPKRVTFLIDKNGEVFDVVKNISLTNYAEKIIEKFEEKNKGLNSNAKK